VFLEGLFFCRGLWGGGLAGATVGLWGLGRSLLGEQPLLGG
jgi:hypothetical protein